jgi:hypothetical protein
MVSFHRGDSIIQDTYTKFLSVWPKNTVPILMLKSRFSGWFCDIQMANYFKMKSDPEQKRQE